MWSRAFWFYASLSRGKPITAIAVIPIFLFVNPANTARVNYQRETFRSTEKAYF